MLYDTVLLRTFAAICDAGSFTKAARELPNRR
jgi:DNA-binding transcriptional LysR family regulator